MAFRYSGKGWRVAHSLKTFGDQIMDLRGHKTSYLVDGTLGNLEHSNRTSDHNPDANGIVRALDFFEHKPGFVDEIAEYLRASRDPRLKYFIHDDRMFASYSNTKGPAWEWREYTGVNGHHNHGHLSVVATSVADQDHEWDLLEEDDMTPELQAEFDAIKAAITEVPDEVWRHGHKVDPATGAELSPSKFQYLLRTKADTVAIRAVVADLKKMETVDLEAIADAVADEIHRRGAE